MKVLKDMTKEGQWVGECQNCFSIVEANSHELSGHRVTMPGSLVSWVSCPVCKSSSKQTLFYPKGSNIANKLLAMAEAA